MVEGAAAHIASEELVRSGLQFSVPSGEVRPMLYHLNASPFTSARTPLSVRTYKVGSLILRRFS